jgi:protein-disulfide isomerase
MTITGPASPRHPLWGLLLTVALLGGGDDDEVAYLTRCPAEGGQPLPSDEAPFLGQPGAPIQVGVFGDLTCPHTVKMLLTLGAYMDALADREAADRVEVQFRHLQRTPSDRVARAIEAAHRQGNDPFWKLSWCLVLEEQITEETIARCAETSVPDLEAFVRDQEGEAVLTAIARDESTAGELGFNGTPGILLCGAPFSADPADVTGNIDLLLEDTKK